MGPFHVLESFASPILEIPSIRVSWWNLPVPCVVSFLQKVVTSSRSLLSFLMTLFAKGCHQSIIGVVPFRWE